MKTILLSSLLSLFLSFSLLSAEPSQYKYQYYLKSNTTINPLYVSSSITYNGHINYVLLTNSCLAQPLSLYDGDGSITLDTSNVIGASSQAPILLSDEGGISNVYKQVILGDQKAGKYTTGFGIGDDGVLTLGNEEFGGFVACTAARGVKQVFWFGGESADIPVTCEEVVFERVWDLNG